MLCGKRPVGDLTAVDSRETGFQVAPLEILSQRQNASISRALAFDREARTASVEKLLEGLVANHTPRTRPHAVVAGAIIVGAAALGLSYWALNKALIPTRSLVRVT